MFFCPLLLASVPLLLLTAMAASPASPVSSARAVAAPATQAEQAARELVGRVTPEATAGVAFRTVPELEGFRISRRGDGILIEAADAARMIAGYGHYLRFVARLHLSWNGDRLDLRLPLPAPDEPLTVERNPWEIRFAYNYCTLSYSAAFWDWNRWQRELDFLALNGFTHLLVTAGLEQVWADFLRGCGYTEKNIASYVAGPAYAAWWHMGNLEGFGGPLSQGMIARQAELGRHIVRRARQLGLTPVVQGYVGLLPRDFAALAPSDGLRVIPQGDWCGLPRPSVVDPTCPAFEKLAAAWYRSLANVYGFSPSWFAGDLFHEGGNRAGISESDAVRAVQSAMRKAAPDAVWTLQAWHGNPSDAFLESLDPKGSLILNLVKDMHAGGAPGRDFRGLPWIWCELSNFGGNTGLYGGLPLMARLGPELAAQRARGLKGLGLLSEGIETNPLYYDFFFSRLATDRAFALDEELPLYAERRYGSRNPNLTEALTLLAHGLYNPDRQQEGCTESILCSRPGWLVNKASTWSTANRYYDPADTLRAARLFIQAGKDEPALQSLPTYRYDLADLVRQVLADAVYDQLQLVRTAWDNRQTEAYDRESARFLAMLRDADALLDTVPAFRLATWTARAAALGRNDREKAVQIAAARQLVTTWSGTIQGLNDYSNRQWSGLIADYYLPRWELFFHAFRGALEGKTSPGEAERTFPEQCHALELAFADKADKAEHAGRGKREDTFRAASRILQQHGTRLDVLARRDRPDDTLPWAMAQGETEAKLDVTDRITRAGDYAVIVRQETGASPGWISVRLFEGSREVARGQLNDEGRGNFHLPALRTNLDAYTLKIDARHSAPAPLRGAVRLQTAP